MKKQEEFKVGDEVAVYHRGAITGTDKVKSITAKRKQIKLEKNSSTFQPNGHSVSQSTWDYNYYTIYHLTLEHRLEIKAIVARNNIKKLGDYTKGLTDEQVRELWRSIKEKIETFPKAKED